MLELFPNSYLAHGNILQAVMINHKYNYMVCDCLSIAEVTAEHENIEPESNLFTKSVERI